MKSHCLICIFAISLTLLIFFGCARGPKEGNMTHGTVYVEDKVVEGLPAFISSTEVRLPFIQTLEALGMIIEKQSDGVCINSNGDTYILYYSPNISLVRQGNTENLIFPPPGTSSYYCRYEEGDVYLDYETLDCVLYSMHVDIDISVDYTSSTIVILTK